MRTWGQLKTDLRQALWPQGESSNLVPAHDRAFVDAIIHIQTFVACQQQDNTSIFPQCSTPYNCGLSVIDSAPQGIIRKLSVIDKINPTTGLEDATAADDYCSEIPYTQVDACHIRSYLNRSRSCGCGLPLSFFFALPPVPTDVGLPKGLPKLPLGFHYPQTSTDRTWGRSGAGIWALERGQIWIAPWLQSTESVIVVWDGIKTTWSDADPISDDPLLALGIKEYVRWKHADEWDKDEGAYIRARDAFEGPSGALAMLIHQCREQTRVRGCEPSHARAANGLTNLFYNDDQSASASCPPGTTGNGTSVTILAGTVASTLSKADANQKARDQAQTQAQQQLVCVTPAVTYTNDLQTATVACSQDPSAPPPDGVPVTVTVPAGSVTSTVSKADANALALAQAQGLASAQLHCVWWNSSQTFTATCPSPQTGGPVIKTTAAHTFSSTVSQADADLQALTAARHDAEAAITCSGGAGTFYNTVQVANAHSNNCRPPFAPPGTLPCQVAISVTVSANTVTSLVSQADANQKAKDLGQNYANSRLNQLCSLGQCGSYSYTI